MKQYIKPTHTLTLEKDIICVWNKNVYIFEKSSSFAIGRLKYYMKLKEIKFNTKKDLYNHICKQTSSVIIFMDNKKPDIDFNNKTVGNMKKLSSYRTGIKCLFEIKVIYLKLSNKISKNLKYIVDDICEINAVKSIKPFRYKLDGIIYN